jgi:O-6-methylguanine DNA methyltransferase
VPIDLQGTVFQREAWHHVLAIPYGCTRTYSEVATAMGRPHGARAVGAANGANPVPILVPCHRLVGASGDLTGYGGGIALKRWLLRLESERR